MYSIIIKESQKVYTLMDTIVNHLKSALASEYQAFHMYRSAYYKVRGPLRPIIIDELWEHSEEELSHAGMLEDRINELGGMTFNDPTEWDVWSTTKLPSILSSDAGEILSVIRDSEESAIALYRDLYNKCEGDVVTQDILTDILKKEEEHLFDVRYNMIGYTT